MFIINNAEQEAVEKMHDNSFPIPDLSNSLYIAKKTAIDNGSIIAIGLVRLTAEGILFTDRDAPLTTRAKASYNIMNALREDLKIKGLDDCHIFVKDTKVNNFMQHFGFIPCKGGQPLVIHF